MQELEEQAAIGELVNATQVQQAYEEKAGRPICRTTVYDVLHPQWLEQKTPSPASP